MPYAHWYEVESNLRLIDLPGKNVFNNALGFIKTPEDNSSKVP